MTQEFVRFMPVLLQLGSPLRVNVYELDSKGNARLVWTLGHVFQPSDLSQVLNPARRLVVRKEEHESAIREIEKALANEGEDLPYWCG